MNKSQAVERLILLGFYIQGIVLHKLSSDPVIL